jgi:ABC-type polysaccharide/polyol phosphate export permease
VFALIGLAISSGHSYIVLGPGLLLIPLGLLLTLFLSFGFGLYLSVAGAFGRDARYSLGYALHFVFFFTPVLYPISAVPKGIQWFAEVNPVTGPIVMVRQGLYGGSELTTLMVVASVGITTVVLVTGLLFFSRWEAVAVDNI